MCGLKKNDRWICCFLEIVLRENFMLVNSNVQRIPLKKTFWSKMLKINRGDDFEQKVFLNAMRCALELSNIISSMWNKERKKFFFSFANVLEHEKNTNVSYMADTLTFIYEIWFFGFLEKWKSVWSQILVFFENAFKICFENTVNVGMVRKQQFGYVRRSQTFFSLKKIIKK